jgi:membrane protease YdiL (CAAX protease family)
LGLSIIHIHTWNLPLIVEWTSITAAAVGEELVFRGYLIERIEVLTGSSFLAIVSSSLLFGIWHLPLWGAGDIIFAVAWGVEYAVFYVWRRDLVASMFMHFMTDALESKDIAFSVQHFARHYWVLSIYLRVAGYWLSG